jgi:hypothetical protein
MEENKKQYKSEWSEWNKFPDPRICDYIYAPFGSGVYQLKNIRTGKYVLFGMGKHLAQRMTSLLPHPLGTNTRNNENKRRYILENIEDIEYRTICFMHESEAKQFEREVKYSESYIFNT